MIFTRKTSNKKKPAASANTDLLDGMIDGLIPKTNTSVAGVANVKTAPQAPASASSGGTAAPKYFSALNVAQPTSTGNTNTGGVATASSVKPESNDDKIWSIIDEMLTKDGQGRQEYSDQLAQSSAEATENARAQTGLAGMGLSGAGAAAVGAQQRKGARESALAMKQFDDAELDKLIQGINLANEQKAADLSFNQLNDEMPSRNDYPAGAEGTQQYNDDLANWKQNQEVDQAAAKDIAADQNKLNDSLSNEFGDSGLDYSLGDATADTGSKEKPYFADESWKKSDLESFLSGADPDSLPLKTQKVGDLTLLVDQYGHYYFLPSMHKNQSYFDFS